MTQNNATPQEWFNETLYPKHGQRLAMDEVLFRTNTGVQELIIFRNSTLGKVLTLDGVVQTTTADEFVYHEMLTHVPLFAHGAPKNVLIIGGGDGGIAREVLKHKTVQRCVMVEIDQGVVDLSLAHLPEISAGAFSDPRLELVIADGCQFVKNTQERFDVIIIDSTDPIGPGEVLFTQEFYGDCQKLLNAGGVMVAQNGVPFFQPEELADTHARRRALFADPWYFVAAVPTYYGGFMTLAWASDTPALRQVPLPELQARFNAANFATRYYTPEIHQACFALPAFVVRGMNGQSQNSKAA